MNLREAAQQVAQQATPREQLLKELMDLRVPKTEREHAAVREIERLRAALAEESMQRLTDVQQDMESASRESRQVEPVAYVTGYSKGYATVRPIDPCLLMPVGMALYRSPKRTPLTDEEIGVALGFGEYTTASTKATLLNISRSIERAHDIGREE